MKRSLGSVALLVSFALMLSRCGHSDQTRGSGADGSTGAAGGAATSGGAGAGGDDRTAACMTFGDACTECAVVSDCSGAYCDCIDTTSCISIWECFDACVHDEDACMDACEANHADGYADFLLVSNCLGSECSVHCGEEKPLGGCSSCVLTDCEAEFEACVADASCNDYLDCLSYCVGPTCLACYESLPDTTLADAISTCTQSKCQDPSECGGACQPLGDACTQCTYDDPSCHELYCDCYADPDCSGYAQCVTSCASGDEDCYHSCEVMYASGFAQYFQMVDCMGSSCETECGFGPIHPCYSCIMTSCSDEINGCVGDIGCNHYFDCTIQCEDLACNDECYNELKDTTEADALSECIQASCSSDCSGLY